MTTQKTNIIAAHSRIDSRSNDKIFTKIITFKTNDELKLPTNIPFPKTHISSSCTSSSSSASININESYHSHQLPIISTSSSSSDSDGNSNGNEEDSKIDELGRKIIHRLKSLGLLNKDVNYSSDESDTSYSDSSSSGIINQEISINRDRAHSNSNSAVEEEEYEEEDEESKYYHINDSHNNNNNNNNSNNNRRKIYNCKINIEMFRGVEKYNVDLLFLYQSKDLSHGVNGNRGLNNNGKFFELPPNLYITFEELINYLRDKIFLSGVNKNFHGIETKINILLKLKSFKCFINDKEFKISRNNTNNYNHNHTNQ